MIEVINLEKKFKIKKKRKNNSELDPREHGGYFHAVRKVDFTCQNGHILGLLGPNGAGKTTVLRMLSTAIKPTAGEINIHGFNAIHDPLEIRKQIGFLSGATGLYGRLTAKEMIVYFGRLHGMDALACQKRLESLVDILEMGSFLDRRNDNLSAGMKQKVNIARTLIHDPKVIVFDEPTTGLDVAAAEAIIRLIEQCKNEGKTVLFSTHHMHEVERLCDSIVLIHEGLVTFTGTVTQMKHQSGQAQMDKAFLALIGKEDLHVA